MTLISTDCKDYTLALKLRVDYMAEDISIDVEHYNKNSKKLKTYEYSGSDLSSALSKYKELNGTGESLVHVSLPIKTAV